MCLYARIGKTTVSEHCQNYGSNGTRNRVSVSCGTGKYREVSGTAYRVFAILLFGPSLIVVYLIKHLQRLTARRIPTETRHMRVRGRALQR